MYGFGVKGQSNSCEFHRKQCVDFRSQHVGWGIVSMKGIHWVKIRGLDFHYILARGMPTPYLWSLVALWSALGGNSAVAHTHLRTKYDVDQINTLQSNFRPHSYPRAILSATKHSLIVSVSAVLYCKYVFNTTLTLGPYRVVSFLCSGHCRPGPSGF